MFGRGRVYANVTEVDLVVVPTTLRVDSDFKLPTTIKTNSRQ